MVDGPPALPDLLVADVAGWTVSEVVSVTLDKPPPVTGVRTEAFTGAQAVHEHRSTNKTKYFRLRSEQRMLRERA